jgi:hypothetical protein
MITTFKISAVVSGLSLCGFVGVASADPISTVLLATPAELVGNMPVGANPRMLNVGPLSPPDMAGVLGVVLSPPTATWSSDGQLPTMTDVISVAGFSNWTPFDSSNPDRFLSGSRNTAIAGASAAVGARMAAAQAQMKQSNTQQMTAFSEAVQLEVNIALDPDRSAFDYLTINESVLDGGLLMTEFQWNIDDMGHAESIFVTVETLKAGFFGE